MARKLDMWKQSLHVTPGAEESIAVPPRRPPSVNTTVTSKRKGASGKWKGRHATCWEHDGAFYSACNGVLKATYTLELVYVAGGAERAQLRSKSWGRGKKPSKVPAVKRPFPNNAGKHPDYGGGTAPQDQERGVRSGARCEVWGSFQS